MNAVQELGKAVREEGPLDEKTGKIDYLRIAIVAECVIERRDQIADVHRIVLRNGSVFVATTIHLTAADATTGQ